LANEIRPKICAPAQLKSVTPMYCIYSLFISRLIRATRKSPDSSDIHDNVLFWTFDYGF
jgi:hypothetical protein